MRIFFLTIFAIYGLAHAYILWKVRQGWPRMGWVVWPIAVFLLAMVFGPVGERLLEAAGWRRLAAAYGRVAFVWIALVLWLVSLFLLADVWRLGAWLAGLHWPGRGRGCPTRAGRWLWWPARWRG